MYVLYCSYFIAILQLSVCFVVCSTEYAHGGANHSSGNRFCKRNSLLSCSVLYICGLVVEWLRCWTCDSEVMVRQQPWALVAVCVCVCMRASPHSKIKTAWAIHTKLGTHILCGRTSASTDPEVKGQSHRVMKCAAGMGACLRFLVFTNMMHRQTHNDSIVLAW